MRNSLLISIVLLFLLNIQVYSQSIDVSGVVKDETGTTMPGATVAIKGTSQGTITDMDGRFALSVPGSESVLRISFVGYEPKEIRVGDQRSFEINMDNTMSLDEVVVVGFGTQKRANATGAVNTIDTEALESRPITNVADGLQGVIAGLNITNDMGGAPGQEMNINIRGLGTIDEGSSSSPLVLIDGMEGSLSSVNPNDIESISVLKDAASAAIYGSRAPFGVILITTKSGDKKEELNYSSNVRFESPINVPDPVDSYTYALMINDAFINSGQSAQFGQAQLSKILAYQNGELDYATEPHPTQNIWLSGQQAYGNTNWYDIHLKDVVTSQEHNLSLSGGKENISYYFSANYLKENGMFTYADDYFRRLSVNGKVNLTLLEKLTLNWNTRLVNTENDKPSALNALFFHNLGRRAPLTPLYLPNGEYSPGSLIPALTNGGRNVLDNQIVYNQAKLTFEPVTDWKIYAEIGSRLENPRESRQFKKLSQTLPDGSQEYFQVLEGVIDRTEVRSNGTFRRQPPAGTNYYEKANGYINYLSSNFRTDYELESGDHFFKVLAGVQSEYFYTEKTRVSSDDILIDEKPFLPSSSGTNPLMSEKKGEWSNLGIFSRLNYVYANKYMAELNFRADGASRFPEDQRWGTFPSFSMGWNIAEEPFFETIAMRGFEMFKFRASYGVLGNQNTTSFYPYYQVMNPSVSGIIIGGDNSTMLPAPAPFTTALTWEKIENTGVGVDFSFWGNRMRGSFDWYKRVTKDMVGPAESLPNIYGATPPKTNNAELETEGWEMELTYRDRIGTDFSYSITMSLSDYQSEVTKYDSPDGAIDGFFKGKKLGDIWGYRVEDIAKSDLEMSNWLDNYSQSSLGSNWGAGDFMYKDLDGSGSVNLGGNSIYDPGDREVIGNNTPRYMYSTRVSGKYKFLDFAVFLQGVGKRDVFFENSATFFGVAAPWQRSLFKEHLDYFRPAGDPLGANLDPYYARLRTSGNNRHINDYYLQDASYLRLKNVQIGFSLPEKNFLSQYVDKARIYFSGENLLTWTDLMIVDPEAVGGSAYGPGKAYPMYSTYSVGLSVTF
ncbi:SusC/RagA family TonB-linked outer membrane protein [Marinilabilia rubra]|uniref:SusC/RagA family protein n=1 Tax=Marinilabilia rubra TaxID=2162893 RepID=A0A2U2BBC1_9BACT|nr:TonB-dependent receptor [Marinilabilia rubra]PWE00372.1 SusC/RagA family protein [Marinilabilia rubra]